MLQLGWKAGPEQFGPVELLQYAIAADQSGFDTIDVSDHFHPWSEAGQSMFTWTWLGAAAVQTKQIHLGTGLTCPILRYNPALIAQASATLACLAPGRTYLAVGTGEALNEYPVTGEWPGYRERRERLEEAIEIIRALWTGRQITYEGYCFSARKAKLYTMPKEAIPLYISTMVPESAHFAGKFGDGMMTVGGDEPEVYREIIKNFEAGAREAGKDPATMPRLIELGVEFTDDKEAAIEAIKKYWAGSFVPALFNHNIYTPKLSEKNGKVVGSDIIAQQTCISANPEDHVKFAQSYVDLGFTHLFFHSAQPDQRRFLEDYGRHVLPRLRQMGGKAKAA